MTSMQPDKNLAEAKIVVNYNEPERKAPPSLSVGPVGWVRKNLFGSAFDTILTIISGLIIVVVTVSMFSWIVGEANWLAVNQNFRNFMAGTYPIESTWRLNVLFLITAFMIGFSVATYSRAGRSALISIGILLAILFAVPVIARTAFPLPKSYLSAGDVSIESGTVTETPETTRAFIARENDQISIEFAGSLETAEEIAELAGFTDRPAFAFFNTAKNQIDAIERIDEIERVLSANERMRNSFLTRARQSTLQDELEQLQQVDTTSLVERYNVNTSPVTITVYKGDTEEVLIEGELTSDADPLTLDIPEDGWYILQMTVAEEDSLALLEARNIYPIITRTISRDLTNENGEPLIDEATGRVQSETIDEYQNVFYSEFIIQQPRPELGGEEVAIARLTDNQFSGERSLSDYMTLYLGPLFGLMDTTLLWFFAVGIIGYVASTNLKRVTPKTPGGGITATVAMGGWMLYVFLLFTMTIGVESMDSILLSTLLAMIVWVGFMYFVGANYTSLDPNIARALLGLGWVLLLGQLVGWRMQTDARPFMNPGEGGLFNLGGWASSAGFIIQLLLWLVVGMSAVRFGSQGESQLGSGTRRRGLIGSFVLWVALFFLVPAIIAAITGANVITEHRSENLMPIARLNLWGGFLLTFMLTAVGIVCSFPIGVLLALGRRAHRLPIVKYACILFIELVRGVPLVTVLFMATLLVPLVNPSLATVPQVVRAMIGITLFSAAYLAENVRGGLQSIPSGQEEAGKAVGLNGVQITMLIMLPQALRAVIPALVGMAIALFKDTSLVIIVGLAELTGVANRVVAQSEFVGLRLETFFFISVIYFIFSYAMSYVSRRIEESGSGSARR